MQQRRRILIADDQKPTRQGLHALLAFLPGIEWVGEAVDGQEAVDLVAVVHPDVVLMDVRMPVMDGIEATRRIKSQNPQVKVIVLTLYSEYQTKALAAGADIFLDKGGSPESLRDAIYIV
ncbi:MAG: response regulator transcription factor [Chloroflexi bacterium]|nr:response regulator transcription factor [Chloroflexota bacterium]